MKKTFVLLHIAVILAGFTGVFGKLISLNEYLLTCYRTLFSFLFLVIIVWIKRPQFKYSWSNITEMGKAGLLIAFHWVFFYASIKYSNVSVGVVCYCLTSFFTAFLAPLINRKPFNITELLLSTLTLAGIGLIFHFDTSFRTGIVLGVISSFLASLYTIFNERLVKKYDATAMNLYQMLAGTIALVIASPLYLHFFPSKAILPGTLDIIYLLLLSLFCTVGLYVMVAEVLKKMSAFTVNLTFNLEPVYSILLAMILFNESRQLNVSFYAGLLIIIISVVLQAGLSRRKSREQAM
ncbi:EamA-like transporter family protein [Mucilaginibacter gossypiicola]|uniref:EamA-like transporter family protein n=1 Tax=Mucilaginibacter gossypiicola TaxID=551995 RepID=A0A1H8F1X0_9SPHI|nr:DMT family transporter [Mucilaginibacter gossypiicola]SEN25656.1 EamA-like transporter family protein [Mucilaginibacter gossypiicola]